MPLQISFGVNTASKKMRQVTIRDIKIEEPFQRCGIFTAFIQYLLIYRKIVVRMEVVLPRWLKEKLRLSPLWILQGLPAVLEEDLQTVTSANPSFIAGGIIGGEGCEIPQAGDYMMPTYARIVGIAENETEFRLF
jgi:hypothetical protein